jgi:hypothetical protein
MNMFSADVAVGIAFLAPLISFVLLGTKLIMAAVLRRLIPLHRWAAWTEASIALLCTAATVYAIWVWSGGLLDFNTTPCLAKAPANPAFVLNLLPLNYSCRYADSSSTQSVPAYVNPVVFLGLAGTLVCIGLAIRAARKERAIYYRDYYDNDYDYDYEER